MKKTEEGERDASRDSTSLLDILPHQTVGTSDLIVGKRFRIGRGRSKIHSKLKLEFQRDEVNERRNETRRVCSGASTGQARRLDFSSFQRSSTCAISTSSLVG